MRNIKIVAAVCIGLMLGGGFAVAAPALQRLLQVFTSGIKLGATGYTLSRSAGATMTWDFISLSGSPISLLKTCDVSNAVTLTGTAAVGDSCLVSATGIANADGGNQLPREASVRCSVLTSTTAVVEACARGFSDGGVVDLPDAGWSIRTFGP